MLNFLRPHCFLSNKTKCKHPIGQRPSDLMIIQKRISKRSTCHLRCNDKAGFEHVSSPSEYPACAGSDGGTMRGYPHPGKGSASGLQWMKRVREGCCSHSQNKAISKSGEAKNTRRNEDLQCPEFGQVYCTEFYCSE